jgi:hypothetical protein
MSPGRGSAPRHTDWPTVSRKVTLSLSLSHRDTVMSPMGLETDNYCANEAQRRFTCPCLWRWQMQDSPNRYGGFNVRRSAIPKGEAVWHIHALRSDG